MIQPWIAPGPNVTNFENEIAEKVGIGYAAALVSGTPLYINGFKSMGVKDGDIVLICQS